MPLPIEIGETEIPAVLEIRAKVVSDERGFLTECYNQDTWSEKGFTESFVQDNLSLSCKGTLRGMHYQIEPHTMGKLVRVIRGAVFDVAVDLRLASPTFGKWVGRELSEANGLMLWVPPGFAHGFLALEDNSLVYYKCTGTHCPEAERSLSYKDPEIEIAWPQAPDVITQKDAGAPLLKDADYNFAYEA